jgi:hypothetical protein
MITAMTPAIDRLARVARAIREAHQIALTDAPGTPGVAQSQKSAAARRPRP